MNLLASLRYRKLKEDKSDLFIWFIYLLVATLYIVSISLIINFQNQTILDVFDDFSQTQLIVISLIVAPFFETLFFQLIIIEILRSYNLHRMLIVFLSAFLFALAHYYNLTYIVATFFIGLLLSYYYLSMRIYKEKYVFLRVFLLHSCLNLFAFLTESFFALLSY